MSHAHKVCHCKGDKENWDVPMYKMHLNDTNILWLNLQWGLAVYIWYIVCESVSNVCIEVAFVIAACS